MPTNFLPVYLFLLFPFSSKTQPLALPISAFISSTTTTAMTPCQSAHDTTAATFQISNFLTFEPSSSSSSTATTLSFTLLDPLSSISTSCTRSLLAADVASGVASLNDSSYYQVCEDTRVSFVWDGTRLTVLETWSCGNVVGELVGHLDFLLSCFDMTSSYVEGEGTLCELMAEEVVGRYTTLWDDTGYYVYGVGPNGSPLE